MAISIDWGAKVIFVPKSYLTNISGELYSLDINQFRLDLKDLEDGEEGIVFPYTHNHNTTVYIGDTTLARVVEITNGYTITFENGSYAVRLEGANSNIEQVVNINSVSIRSSNTAGLIQVSSGGGGGGGGGLTIAQALQLIEIWQRLGLDLNNPLINTESSISAGAEMLINVAKNPDQTILTRQP